MKPEGFSIEQVEYRTKITDPEVYLRYAIRRDGQHELIRRGFVVRPRVGVVR